jgi:hypothetical protein
VAASEKLMARWLKATGVIYAAGAVDFTVHPRGATEALSGWGGTPLDAEPPGLYNALASAYMATIAALALTASRDPKAQRALIPPLLVAKATSSAGLLLRYARTRRRGFAAAALLDALLFGVTAGLLAAQDD